MVEGNYGNNNIRGVKTQMKNLTKFLTILLGVTLIITILPTVTLAEGENPAVDQLVIQINAIHGLLASVDRSDPTVVNVDGFILEPESVFSTLALNIGPGITVRWRACIVLWQALL
ncbi:MAG: hypothetical protein FWG55_02600 [Candidatus Bathyarchaeota archaeon]|nr:hypothetical protein [Candidatus Termiticorpusculum sp.]